MSPKPYESAIYANMKTLEKELIEKDLKLEA